MSDVAIGIDDHRGWAHLVSVAVAGSEVTVLDRRRVALLDPDLPTQPYHTETSRMAPADAERLVQDVKASANAQAQRALESLIGELDRSVRCRAIAIRIPTLAELPADVAEVNANSWLGNRADGVIYHRALTAAAAPLRLTVFQFDKAQILAQAASHLGIAAAEFEARLKEFGKALGPPWQQGHRIACAGAIMALDQVS